MSARLILLAPSDTILVCVAAIAAGDALVIEGETIASPGAVEVGHKVARQALRPGDKVIKHGAPIGSITADTARGEWVHVHNMKSDYISTHDRRTVTEQAR